MLLTNKSNMWKVSATKIFALTYHHLVYANWYEAFIIAQVLLASAFNRFGVPLELHSYQRYNFESAVIQKVGCFWNLQDLYGEWKSGNVIKQRQGTNLSDLPTLLFVSLGFQCTIRFCHLTSPTQFNFCADMG